MGERKVLVEITRTKRGVVFLDSRFECMILKDARSVPTYTVMLPMHHYIHTNEIAN